MNDRDFQAWADAIDSRPSYATRTSGRVISMRYANERPRFPRLERRQYQLRQMEARMRMEDLVGR